MKPIQYKNVKEGLYSIDENGNVYSNYKKGYLIPKLDKDGYLQLVLSGGSRDSKCYVRIATLVAWHYIGPPKNLLDPTINHIDNNKINNHYTNLEWVERGQNSSMRENKGQGITNHQAKLTEQQVEEICNLLVNINLTYDEIGQRFNVTKSNISNIKNGKSWTKITQSFDFSCRQLIRNSQGRFESININFGSTGKGEKDD